MSILRAIALKIAKIAILAIFGSSKTVYFDPEKSPRSAQTSSQKTDFPDP